MTHSEQPKTVSLETARKLKEAGWPQGKSERYWATVPKGSAWIVADPWCEFDDVIGDEDVLTLRDSYTDFSKEETEHFMSPESARFFAAPDVSELLEALPEGLELWKDRGSFAAKLAGRGPICDAATSAEALAALYLELKKQKLL